MRFAYLISGVLLLAFCSAGRGETASEPLSLVVMDPLAAPLSCPCVEGYAQREYEKFAAALGEKIGRSVNVTFAESLEKALQQPGCKQIDVIIGKDSVVRADAAKKKMQVTPIAQLTGKDGKTSQAGLIVVPSQDRAQNVADLAGYRIIYGSEECDEKFAAPRKMLTEAGVKIPAAAESETSPACSDGATLILELDEKEHGAAVISSYAAPLLEGCGTVKKGDLRVLATTEPVPFITLFLSESITKQEQSKLAEALIETSQTPDMLIALESLLGFVPLSADYHQYHKSQTSSQRRDKPDADERKSAELKNWPGWRGPHRDGHCDWLPHVLPTHPKVFWQRQLIHEGLGGIAAADDIVIVGDRDFSNLLDEFHAYDSQTGEPRWTVRYPAPGHLDYDNSPRATPLITQDHVYLFGAFGDLHCVNRQSGLIVWRKNILQEFAVESELVWGTCSSPLLIDDKLIVNPGGKSASLIALDAATGSVLWQTAGGEFAFASPLLATFHGIPQILAFDRQSLGGFCPATGQRLWTHTPPFDGDFNVPSPVYANEKLILTSENNGTRLHEFTKLGTLVDEPVGTYEQLAPDMSTPVVVGNRLFCVSKKLYCLDLTEQLREIWIGRDMAFGDYASIIASKDRLLIVGRGGEVLLVDATADGLKILSRFNPFGGNPSKAVVYAQPAVVDNMLFVRAGKKLACVSLAK